MSNLRSQLIRLAHEHPEFRKDLLPLLKQAKVGPQKFIGVVGGYLYAIKVPGLDPDDLTKRGMSGVISANAAIKAWRAEGGGKEDWILTKPRKGQKPGSELRKWLVEVNPSEFYARWDLTVDDDTRQIFYKS